YLLAGLLRCEPCDAGMTPTWSGKNGRRYRYYTCLQAQKRGWASCPTKSVPAREIERAVVDHIRAIGGDPDLVEATVRATREQLTARRRELEAVTREAQAAIEGAHVA